MTMWLVWMLGCADETVAPPTPALEPAVAVKPTKQRPATALGQEVTDLEVTDWLVGEGSLASGEATLLVFWEPWCPHCRKELPKLQELHEHLGPQGLNVVALTRLTRNTPRQDALALVADKVTYATGVGGHGLAERLGVRGIPSAVVVKDGAVIWSGHPARLTEPQLLGWLGT